MRQASFFFMKVSLSDIRNYNILVDNYGNGNFSIPSKDIFDYEISLKLLWGINSEKTDRKANSSLSVAFSNISNNSYKLRRKLAGYEISKIKERVFEMYGHKCLCCGTYEDISIDHIVPVAKGGGNDIENLQPLCRSCNSKKRCKIIDYR